MAFKLCEKVVEYVGVSFDEVVMGNGLGCMIVLI